MLEHRVIRTFLRPGTVALRGQCQDGLAIAIGEGLPLRPILETLVPCKSRQPFA